MSALSHHIVYCEERVGGRGEEGRGGEGDRGSWCLSSVIILCTVRSYIRHAVELLKKIRKQNEVNDLLWNVCCTVFAVRMETEEMKL